MTCQKDNIPHAVQLNISTIVTSLKERKVTRKSPLHLNFPLMNRNKCEGKNVPRKCTFFGNMQKQNKILNEDPLYKWMFASSKL